MTRSELREHIFKLLFRVEFNDIDDIPEQMQFYFESPVGDDEDSVIPAISEKDSLYIKDKYEKIAGMLPKLDEIIDEASKGWKSNRIGKVELTILRLAVYEMKYDDDIPIGVAINEAVELAKKFGQEESSSFINGILSGVVDK